ncbi:GspH/FimT family protein [Pandoraea pneumonica]|uniref:GspH/FimT family protein n=2 Tax=Pandoraea pneumonica TaxID=2508299 RepID=UPI003CF54C28
MRKKTERPMGARGVTMLECLVVMAVLAMAAVAAAPSIQAVRNRVSVEMTARALLAAMNTARAEALGRHRRVAIAPYDGANWNSGWVTFVDDNLSDIYDAGEIRLASYAPLPAGVKVKTNWGLYERPVMAFAENGFLRTKKRGWLSGNVAIEGHGRRICITVNAYGRPRVEKVCAK